MRTSKANAPASRTLWVTIGLALAVSLSSTGSVQGMPRAEKHETRHQIEHLETAWCNALLKGNSSAMDALLSDDYMAITPTGILQSKDQTIANIRAGSVHFASIELTDRKIRLYGATALVTSRAEVKGTGPDGDISGSYRYSRVYVKDPRGAWRIVSFEANRILEPGERH
jgi:ketosteroid isomerase-like protein